MKVQKWCLFIWGIFFLTSTVPAQVSHGFVKEGLTIDSQILQKKVRYTIYLPFDYLTSQRFYPVVYLLHGYSDNDMGWIQFGEANRLADQAIAEGTIPPMILVMPDGGVSWYINSYDNKVRYEDFFFQEFLPYIESNYRIRPQKRYRGISGLSMGGYGSLVYSLKHPEIFTACAAFSAGIWTEDEIVNQSAERWAEWQAALYGPNLKGKKRLTPHLRANNPIDIVKNADAKKIKKVRFYIDCGDDDFLYKGNSTLHILMRDLNIAHEYRVRDGHHSWSYWRSGLVDGLKFIGASFHQE